MAMIEQLLLLLRPSVVAVALISIPVIIILNLVFRLFSSASLPSNLPWVGTGADNGPLGRARANLTSFFDLKSLLDEGYRKYSKENKAYVLPYFLNGHQVILPPNQVDWLLKQPDGILSQEHVNRQFLEADYTFLHANLVDDPVHPEIIKHELTRNINSFAGDIAEEMEKALEESWGVNSEEWTEVKVYDSMLHVITRLSTRVFMGQPLSRNPEFLEVCQAFNRNVALSAAAISILPGFLKPIFAPFITFSDYLRYKKCSKFIMPTIEERLGKLQPREKLPLFDEKHPNDYVQWAINHAVAKPSPDPKELDPRVIACRFAVLCFAAIQSSVITLTNTLFDVAASPTCEASLERMRAEAEAAAAAAVDVANAAPPWSKTALARLTHIDSALRESLRLNGFIERGVMKMVVAPRGVTLPDGSHLPRGTKVGVSGYSVHHDDDRYPDAATYDAFRFARSADGDNNNKNGKPCALVSTSENFMGFSHGSHACPGRFFAANQLKIALAHIALRYEIEPIRERPVNRWFFGHIAPPLHETLRVRRRR